MSLFEQFAVIAEQYIAGLNNRSVYPSEKNIQQLNQLIEPLQEEPIPAEQVLNILNDKGSPATVTSTGGRYYGFVCGSSLPAVDGCQITGERLGSECGYVYNVSDSGFTGRNQQQLDD